MTDARIVSEIDLVPSDYRAHRARIRIAITFSWILSGLLLGGGGAYGALRYQTWRIESEVEQLEKQTLVSTQQRERITELRKVAEDYQRQLDMLTRLRSGGQAEDIFTTIDGALSPGEVWFQMWNFQRAGFVIEDEANEVNRGYFIVIPDGAANSSSKPWQIETHLSIKGQARDHATLSVFVGNLFEQPKVEDVRVVNTSRRRYQDVSVVDFDLRLVLRSSPGGL